MSAYRDPLPPLPPLTRILLMILGWILVLVGVAGLVLPGLQGILTILLGGALLSLVSRSILSLMRKWFGRWPRAWRKLLRLRRSIHRWISGGAQIGKGHSENA